MLKNKKSLTAFALAGAILFSNISFGAPNTKNAKVTIDEGIRMTWNDIAYTPKENNGTPVYPIIYNGRTYLPIRFIVEKAGINADWNGATKSLDFYQEVNNININKNNNLDSQVQKSQNLLEENNSLKAQQNKLEKENNNLKTQVKNLTSEIKTLENYKKNDKEDLDYEIKQALRKERQNLETEFERKMQDLLYKQKELEKKLEAEKRQREAIERLNMLNSLNNPSREYITGLGEVIYK